MKIKTLTLENFRCFEHIELNFDEQFNVLIGENGSGKSAILEALIKVIARMFFLAGERIIPSIQYIGNEDKDVRYISTEDEKKLVPLSSVQVGYSLYHYEDIGKMSYNYSSPIDSQSFLLCKKISNLLQTDNANIPVFVYYSVARGYFNKINTREYEKKSRFEGYKEWIAPNANINDAISWLKNRESADLQQKIRKNSGEKVFEMDLIRQVAKNCIPNAEDVYYDFDTTQLMLNISGNALPFNLLSSGFQNMFALLIDLVFRCARLNPHLRENACQEAEGIVLIDELDLHLHPKWQERIVNDLKKTFPNIQFIVATHSPLIIQDVPKSQIIMLNQNKVEIPTFEPNLLTPDSILTQIQGVVDIETEERKAKLEELANIDISMLTLKKEGKENSQEMQQYWIRFREIAQELNWDFQLAN